MLKMLKTFSKITIKRTSNFQTNFYDTKYHRIFSKIYTQKLFSISKRI